MGWSGRFRSHPKEVAVLPCTREAGEARHPACIVNELTYFQVANQVSARLIGFS
jgi:hypothetical protein